MRTGREVREYGRRYVALAFNYATERGVLLLAILLPTLAGATDAQLGRVELLLTATALAAALGPLGTQHALIYEQFRGNRRNWQTSVMIASLGGFVIGAAATSQLGAPTAIAGAILGSALAIHRVASYRIRVADSMAPLVQSSLAFGACFVAGSVVVILAGGTLWVTVPAVLSIAALIAAAPAFRMSRLDVGDEPSSIRAMLRYGLPLSIDALAMWVVVAADRYVIAAFEGLAAVGPYGVIYRSVMVLSGVVATIVMWWQAECMRRGFEWASRALRAYVLSTFGTSVALAAIAWIPLAAILTEVAGVPRSTVTAVVGWLLLSIVGFVVFQGYVYVFAAAAWVGTTGVLSALNAAINLGLNLLLVPRMGIVGAAMATGISQCSIALIGAAIYALRTRTRVATGG